jgi:hypothetical protein
MTRQNTNAVVRTPNEFNRMLSAKNWYRPPLIMLMARKHSGTTLKPTITAMCVPNRSVKRPATGINSMVTSGSEPTSAKSALDQPSAAINGGPKVLRVK